MPLTSKNARGRINNVIGNVPVARNEFVNHGGDIGYMKNTDRDKPAGPLVQKRVFGAIK